MDPERTEIIVRPPQMIVVDEEAVPATLITMGEQHAAITRCEVNIDSQVERPTADERLRPCPL